MAEIMQGIFVTPPIAVARLGGSTTPQDAYKWLESPNPRSSGETTIAPDWSLTVLSDAAVTPSMPSALQLRDGPLIRPVCPFFELWALLGEPDSAPATWREAPITPALLAQHAAGLGDLLVRVDAQNRKVARRTSNTDLSFGTFPPLELRGDDHAAVALLATSPPRVAAARKLIPAGRNIPLGFFQVLKSTPQPAPGTAPWTTLVDGQPLVNVEAIRFRFTPARGHFYGPPATALPQTAPGGASFAPVESGRAFLNPNAGWSGFVPPGDLVVPADTYDGADVGRNQSLGVVDDTCEARIEVSLALPGGRTLSAAANVFVGPPDFAPDRRPFLSLADELNDRSGDSSARTAVLSPDERDAWVENLFERIYETVALLNIDFWRGQNALTLSGNRLAATPISDDQVPDPRRAMGGRDALRSRLFALAAPNPVDPLPLTRHGRMRHRVLSDRQNLRDLIAQTPGRLQTLVRPPTAE